MTKRRKWTTAEKMTILEEIKFHGVTTTIGKNEINYGSFKKTKSLHSIEERVICSKSPLDDLKQTQDTFHRFRQFYNFELIHSSIEYLSPVKDLNQKWDSFKSRISVG